MTDNSLPIGVFDSGVGGLTVAREILRNLPNEKIIYFGDTARVPYGNKSADTIIRYSKQIARFLLSKEVKAITIACNTASALALSAVREELDIPVIGVVKPGATAATRETRNNHIGVIGTKGTVNSGLYEKLICDLNPGAEVFSTACPLFVNLVEEGMIDDPITVQMIHRYLDDMIDKNDIDTLILGCTHYPLLLSVLARELGAHRAGDGSASGISLVNPAYETAIALKDMLKANDLLSDRTEPVAPEEHSYYVSDDAATFRRFAEDVLGIRADNVELKVLE
ncbi:MAG: glutamate racemase [Lachnospiraceae bacterium]|nr:glutamate racemase [Lachnospiraceae bacterium]